MTIFLKLLLFSYCLTFINAKVFFTNTQIRLYENHLHDFHKIISVYYNVQLESDIEINTFFGECNINITILVPIQYLLLYSKVKCINNIIMTDNPSKIYGNNTEIIVYPINYLYKNINESAQIFYINFILPEHYILFIKYHDIINHDTKLTTFYKQKYKWWLMPTHFDIPGARRVFLYLSEFLRATFNITIKHYCEYAVLSITVQKVEEDDEGVTLTHIETTPLLPTYLIRGIVTNFYNKSTEITNVWYRNCSALRMVFAESVIYRTALYLKSKWNNVISKVNHFAIPNFPDEDMGNLLGLVFYREEDIIYDEKLEPAAHKIEISHLIGYKISQEWFHKVYNLISASALFWFNDCLIRFLGIDAVDKALPDFHIMDLFVIQSHHDILDFETSYNTSSFNSSFESHRCIKVSIMLRMLQKTVSENIFWKFMRTYIINNDLDYKNLTRSLNESIVDTHLSTIKVYESKILDIIHIMDPWTNQNHYPTISVTREYDDPDGKLEVLIVNYNSSYHYCIPLTYTTQSDLIFNDTLSLYWLNMSHFYLFNLKLKKTDWLMFNIQQIGYYRVNYDLGNWKRIAYYLDTENYMKIHVLNRAQIIDDAFHFMITKQLPSFIFWKITKYLEQEIDFVAWYPMFKALECMSSVFPLPGEESDRIKLRMRTIFHKVLEKLEYEEIPNESDFKKRLRQEAAKWACFFDDQICKEIANRNLERYLEYPEKYELLPWWKKWTYYNGLKLMSHSPIFNYENTTWWIAHYLGNENFKTKIPEFFACFEHPNIITNYLNLKGTNNKTSLILPKDFSNQDYINCFLFTIAKYAREDEGLNFILHKFIDIKPKKIKIAVVYTVLIDHLYFKEQIEKVKKFLTRHLKGSENYILKTINENLQEPLDKILEITAKMIYIWKKEIQLHKQFLTKLDIRSRQIESQIKYLNNLVI